MFLLPDPVFLSSSLKFVFALILYPVLDKDRPVLFPVKLGKLLHDLVQLVTEPFFKTASEIDGNAMFFGQCLKLLVGCKEFPVHGKLDAGAFALALGSLGKLCHMDVSFFVDQKIPRQMIGPFRHRPCRAIGGIGQK